MTTLLAVVAVAALAVSSPKQDTPAARTLRGMWVDLRAAGWLRILTAIACVVFGGFGLVLASTARAGLYSAGVGVAALCCWAATRSSLTHRRVRVRLEFA